MGAEFFHADGPTDNEANSRFSQFCERAKKRVITVNFQCTKQFNNTDVVYNVFKSSKKGETTHLRKAGGKPS